MKKINFNSKKFKGALSGKGFYAAIFACVLAIGGASFVAYQRTLDKLQNDPGLSLPNNNSSQGAWDYSAVDKNQQGISKDDSDDENSKEDDEPVQAEQKFFVMPVNGDVLTPYSNKELVKSETTGIWKTHDGVDIKGELGTQVKAMSSGTVTKIWDDGLLGVSMTIDHGNGYEGHYHNLNKTLPVKEGDKVNAGTIIGAIGDTAEAEISLPSHLHFGVKLNGEWVDPIATIKNKK